MVLTREILEILQKIGISKKTLTRWRKEGPRPRIRKRKNGPGFERQGSAKLKSNVKLMLKEVWDRDKSEKDPMRLWYLLKMLGRRKNSNWCNRRAGDVLIEWSGLDRKRNRAPGEDIHQQRRVGGLQFCVNFISQATAGLQPQVSPIDLQGLPQLLENCRDTPFSERPQQSAC